MLERVLRDLVIEETEWIGNYCVVCPDTANAISDGHRLGEDGNSQGEWFDDAEEYKRPSRQVGVRHILRPGLTNQDFGGVARTLCLTEAHELQRFLVYINF